MPLDFEKGRVETPCNVIYDFESKCLMFLDLCDTPDTYVASEGFFVRVKQDGSGLEFVPYSSVIDERGGVLWDNSKTYSIGDIVSYDTGVYKSLANANNSNPTDPAKWELLLPTTFLKLNDTPISYAGYAGRSLIVNQTEDGIVFANVSGEGTGYHKYIIPDNGFDIFDALSYYNGQWQKADTSLEDHTAQGMVVAIKDGMATLIRFGDIMLPGHPYQHKTQYYLLEDGSFGIDPSGQDLIQPIFFVEDGSIIQINVELPQYFGSVGIPGGQTFLSLTDTPSTYTGSDGMIPVVNEGMWRLEFKDLSLISSDKYVAIDDTYNPHYLRDILNPGTNISFVYEPAPDGQLTISANLDDEKVKIAEADTYSGFLLEKIEAGDNVNFQLVDNGPRGYGIRINAEDTGEVDDKTVKVSTDDTTPDFLQNKISAGNYITLSIVNDGADESLHIESEDTRAFINLTDTPSIWGGIGQTVKVAPDGQSLEFTDFPVGEDKYVAVFSGNIPGYLQDKLVGSGGVSLHVNIDDKIEIVGLDTLTALTDTPGDYGNNGQVLTSTGTGTQWADAGAGVSTFLALTDTPADYTGNTGKSVRVNATEDALEFFDLPPGSTDELVAVNSGYTPSFLETLLVAGTNITLDVGASPDGKITINAAGAGGVDQFTELLDTPSDYTGSSGLQLRVNATEDAIEFFSPAADEYVDSVSFDTSSGNLTLTRAVGADLVENLDGRYLTSAEDVKVKADSSDVYSGYLTEKIAVGSGLTKTVTIGDPLYDRQVYLDNPFKSLIALTDTPNDYGTNGYFLQTDGSGATIWAQVPSGGVNDFISLTDTPSDYGTDGQVLRVNGTDAVEYVTLTLPYLDDVLSTMTPSNTNLLKFDSTDGKWKSGVLQWGEIDGAIPNQADLQAALDTKENWLNVPAGENYILSSTTAGARSWIDPATTGLLSEWYAKIDTDTYTIDDKSGVSFDAENGINVSSVALTPNGFPGGGVAITFRGDQFTGTTMGMVPDGTAAGDTRFLRSDGTWVDVSEGTDELVKLTETDTIASYLGYKLVEGSNIHFSNTGPDPTYGAQLRIDWGANIADLTDVRNDISPSTGDFLGWDSVNSRWDAMPVPGGGATTLIDLTDTPSDYGTDGQVLTTNGINSTTWTTLSGSDTDELAALNSSNNAGYLLDLINPGVGIGINTEGTAPDQIMRIENLITNINDLDDVDTYTTLPNVSDVLTWDGTNWIPRAFSGGGTDELVAVNDTGTPGYLSDVLLDGNGIQLSIAGNTMSINLAASLSEIEDVRDDISPGTGDYLGWDSTQGKWDAMTISGGGADTFLDLTDTPNSYGANVNDILIATSDSLAWLSGSAYDVLWNTGSGWTGVELNMSLLSDVNSGMSPNDGDILRWNDSASEWDSYELPTGAADEKVAVDGSYTANYLINVLGGGVGISLNASSPPTGKLNINWNAALNDLDDVNTGSPLTNQVLTWSGSFWYAKTMSGSATDELVAIDSDDDGGYLENKLTASGGIQAEKIGGTGNKRIDIHLLDKVTTRVDEHSFSILGKITDRDYWGYFVYNESNTPTNFERYYIGAMIKKGPPTGETYTVQIIKSDYNGSNEVIMNSVAVSNFHSVNPSSPILLNRSNMVFLRVSGTSPAQTCEDLVVTILVETRMI